MIPGLATRPADSYRLGVEMRACGIFYRLSSSHYFLPTDTVPADTPVVKGDKLPLTGMFNVWFALSADGEKVGFIISSSFPTIDKGGILLASLNKGKGRAKSVEVHLKTKDMVIYHYPNRGTMIVNPLMGDSMATILEEQ